MGRAGFIAWVRPGALHHEVVTSDEGSLRDEPWPPKVVAALLQASKPAGSIEAGGSPAAVREPDLQVFSRS
jgi:hypothetical protein